MDDNIAKGGNTSLRMLEQMRSENKKLQGQINEINKEKSELKSELQDLTEDNSNLEAKINYLTQENFDFSFDIDDLTQKNRKLEEKLEAKEKKKIMADSIWNAYSDIAFKYGNTQHKYRRGFWGLIKKFFQGLDVNYIVLGLSIFGSLLTFTSWFNGLFIKLVVDNSGKVLLVGNGLDFYKIIMIKIPFAIVGFLAYRNIQRNRLFEEEYNHKKNIMKIYAEFIYDDFVKDEMKAIMLRAVESNPNDKLIKKDKDMTEKIIKVIENTVKTALQKEKNSNK